MLQKMVKRHPNAIKRLKNPKCNPHFSHPFYQAHYVHRHFLQSKRDGAAVDRSLNRKTKPLLKLSRSKREQLPNFGYNTT